MKARAAKFADVEHVLDRLSTVSAGEMKALGRNRWHAMGNARACMNGGGLDCLFLDARNPLAVIGSMPKTDHPAIHRTWFIASQEYFDLGAKAILGSMRYMSAWAKAKPRITFEAFTASEHPDLDRWFAFMGFKLQERFEHVSLFRRLPLPIIGTPANLDAA